MNDWFSERMDVQSSKPLAVDLKADPSLHLVRVTGDCRAELEFACARCLGPFQRKVDIDIEETFTLNRKDFEADKNEELHLVKEDKVDLTPYLKENVLLALPYVSLCKEECLGLCPVCGNNRNESDCGCREDRTDPRLAALQDFFKDKSDG